MNYFIAIGGSGAKVLEAFVHLAAAGLLKPKDAETAVCLIDQDCTNGNSAKAMQALAAYHAAFGGEANVGFARESAFRVPKLGLPFGLTSCAPEVDPNAALSNRFATDAHHPADLLAALFSEEERALQLRVGFQGRPAIGALVFTGDLRRTRGEPNSLGGLVSEIRGHAARGEEVRIFIVASMFGGTGASGFPTLARLLHRELSPYLRNVNIGGAILTPYFSYPAPTKEQLARVRGPIADAERFQEVTLDNIPFYQELVGSGVLSDLFVIGARPLMGVEAFAIGDKAQLNKPLIPELIAALFAENFYAFGMRDANAERTALKTRVRYSVCDEDPQSGPMLTWRNLFQSRQDQNQRRPLKRYLAPFARFCHRYLYVFGPSLYAPIPDVQAQPWFRRFFSKTPPPRDAVRHIASYCELWLRYFQDLEAAGQCAGWGGVRLFNSAVLFDSMPQRFEALVRQAAPGPGTHDIRLALDRVDIDVPGLPGFLFALLYACQHSSDATIE